METNQVQTKMNEVRTCQICGNEYIRRGFRQKYCSRNCNERAKHEREKLDKTKINIKKSNSLNYYELFYLYHSLKQIHSTAKNDADKEFIRVIGNKIVYMLNNTHNENV